MQMTELPNFGWILVSLFNESRFAYKDIEEVMANQRDLVLPIKKLTTIGVIKG